MPQFLSMSEKNWHLTKIEIFWLNSYNLLTNKNGLKSSRQLKIIFLFISVLNTLQYKNVYISWHFQNLIHNIQTRFSQFTDQKKYKMVQAIQIELSIYSNATSVKYNLMLTLLDFSVLWFKDSTHTIYWLTKWQLKKYFEQFTDQIKKAEKYLRVKNDLSIKDNIKALKYKSCFSFRACQKKIVEITDSTHTITDQQI